jgi:NADPH-dependent 2,4-dienoyl-CoA reductase/sulfur reductase-like enzyme
MKLVIIGAVAGGTSAGAKARRGDPTLEITIYEKDSDISYAACGLPFYIGGITDDIEDLIPRTFEDFKSKYDIDVHIKHEVIKIDAANKKIHVKNLETGEEFEDHFDTLVIATGAYASTPDIIGKDSPHVFNIRTVNDGKAIKAFIEQTHPKKAVIVGTGFIGFEMLENLTALDMDVTLIDNDDKLTPHLDLEMAELLYEKLRNKGVKLKMNASIARITEKKVIFENEDALDADLVILAIGIRPETKLASDAGIELGETKAIKVNTKMQTNIKDIYACGDCIETFSLISGKPVYIPLGTTANKTGRIAGDVITGGSLSYQGNLKTSIFKIFEFSVAMAGLSLKEATDAGFEVVSISHKTRNKPDYMGGEEMYIFAIADKKSHRLLGVQIIGQDGVDKHIDCYVILMTYGIKVEEFFHLDLAYAPPFANVKDAVHYTGMILEGKLKE